MKRTVLAAALASAAVAPAAALETKEMKGGGGAGLELKDIFKEHTEAVETRLKELGVDMDVLKEQLAGVEQKQARATHYGGRGAGGDPSAGEQFVHADQVKGLMGDVRAGMRVGVQVKAVITSATADADGSAGAFVTPYRDGVVPLAKRQPTIRDLLPVVRVNGGSVEFPRQTGFTNNAATVDEAALKPQSEIKYELVQLPLRTIAHWVLASRQILDDAPQLQGAIDTELIYGLKYVEDNQLLNGAGTGTDLDGIYTQATAFASPFASAMADMDTKLDVIGAAILQNALANEPATGIVLHPSDWTEMRLTKNADGEYIMGAPGAAVEPRLFGLPVVATAAMGAGNFLVGNFDAATLYDRWEARIEVSTEDSDNFRKNLVTLLAEERIGLAVKRATAFTKGGFAAAITDLTT